LQIRRACWQEREPGAFGTFGGGDQMHLSREKGRIFFPSEGEDGLGDDLGTEA
jgi:hypothetical protein